MATRLPLRMVPQAQLRKAWSEGHTYYQGVYETLPPRGIEKPVEDMTLDELVATQNNEPLSESRRSWLTTGKGVLSLDAPASPEHIQALIDFVTDDGPRCIHAAIDPHVDNDEISEDTCMADARRYGTPYTTVDPTTQKQILWEQERSQDGPLYKMRLAATTAGRITVENIGRGLVPGSRHTFLDLARSAIQSIFASVGKADTLDELHQRIDLLADVIDDPVAALHHDPDGNEERERYFLSDDRIVHNSYEELNDDGDLIEHHRSARRSPWELWHNTLPRNSSDPLELGMDLCSNAELESLLGVTEWDSGGDMLDIPWAAVDSAS